MNKETLTALGKKHGITAALVGGAFAIGSNYGSCTIDLASSDEPAAIEEEVAAEADDAAPEEGAAAMEE